MRWGEKQTAHRETPVCRFVLLPLPASPGYGFFGGGAAGGGVAGREKSTVGGASDPLVAVKYFRG